MNLNIYISFFSIFTYCAYGASGSPDTTYGPNNTGIATIAIGRNNSFSCIALKPDNGLFGVGTVTVKNTVSGICSFSPQGALDPNFNTIGYVQSTIENEAILTSIALQSDGKIIVAGYTVKGGTRGLVARYNPDGSLDTSFAENGYITTNVSSSCAFFALIIQPDDNIVAGGVAGEGTPSFVLARYTTDGQLDETFGNAGIARVNPGYVSSISALSLQADGKIVATGFTWNTITTVFPVVRFNSNGTLDNTFGQNGVTTTQIGNTCQATAIAIQQDGKIIVGGYTTDNNTNFSFALSRYNSDGSLDETFNETGIVITHFDYSAQLRALAIQHDGKIVAGGSNFAARTTNFALARYLPSGNLDSSFGTNGTTQTSIGSTAEIAGLVIQSDNKIVAAGMSDDSGALARYIP